MARTLLAAALAAAALLAGLLLAPALTASTGHPGEDARVIHVLLCAAARKAWEKVIEIFEEETGVRVVAVYGSSGQLLSALEAGAPADVFAPASPSYMAEAVRRGLVDPSTIRPVAFMVPVVAVPAGNPANVTSVYDLARPGVRVVLGDLESTAIGRHSRMVLERLGILDRVLANVVAYADTFTRLASIIAVGAADATIAWNVIAYWMPGRVETIPIPREAVTASWIPIAVTSTARDPELARAFIDFVTGDPRARSVFESLGYLGPDQALEMASGVEMPWLLAGSS